MRKYIIIYLCKGGIDDAVFVGETDHLLVGTGGFIDRLIDFLSKPSGEGFLSIKVNRNTFFKLKCVYKYFKVLIK